MPNDLDLDVVDVADVARSWQDKFVFWQGEEFRLEVERQGTNRFRLGQ